MQVDESPKIKISNPNLFMEIATVKYNGEIIDCFIDRIETRLNPRTGELKRVFTLIEL